MNSLFKYKELPLFYVDFKVLKSQMNALIDNILDQLKKAAFVLLRNLKKGYVITLIFYHLINFSNFIELRRKVPAESELKNISELCIRK